LAIRLNLTDPTLNVRKADWIRYAINNNDSITALIKAFGDGSKSFLPGSIPNIEHCLVLLIL